MNMSVEGDTGQDVNENQPKAVKKLSAAMKARIERNRQKALLLRESRLVEKNAKDGPVTADGKKAASGYAQKLIDSGGGFFIEEDPEAPQVKYKRVEEPAPIVCGEEAICVDCGSKFRESYLLKTFDHATCDSCKDMDDKHKLIPKTEAKNKYQLTDVDLDKREPVLKFFSRKNPHNPRWGEMKLYLMLQVEERALEIHGSLEEIEVKRELKNSKKEATRKKKYQKAMNKLRKEVRSSLYTKETGGHEHEYGGESLQDEENDIWMKKCKTCGHELTYEKM